MAVKTDCPRCKAHLQVPNKLAGGYVNCPQCKGRLWVAKNAPSDTTSVDGIALASGDSAIGRRAAAAAPPMASPSSVPSSPPIRNPATATVAGAPAEIRLSPRKAGDGRIHLESAPILPPAPDVPSAPVAPAAPVQKHVARLVTAEAAESTFRLAADGKLPELSLEEAGSQRQETKAKAMNPVMLLVALGVSIVFSVVLVLMPGGPSTALLVQRKAAMRQRIEEQYFGSENVETKGLEPYQRLLRDALRAYDSGKYAVERRKYVQVMEMLREERDVTSAGLTGSRTRDRELEEALSVLLER